MVHLVRMLGYFALSLRAQVFITRKMVKISSEMYMIQTLEKRLLLRRFVGMRGYDFYFYVYVCFVVLRTAVMSYVSYNE